MPTRWPLRPAVHRWCTVALYERPAADGVGVACRRPSRAHTHLPAGYIVPICTQRAGYICINLCIEHIQRTILHAYRNLLLLLDWPPLVNEVCRALAIKSRRSRGSGFPKNPTQPRAGPRRFASASLNKFGRLQRLPRCPKTANGAINATREQARRFNVLKNWGRSPQLCGRPH